jgi:hypothetical protein
MASSRHRQLSIQQEKSGPSRLRNEVRRPKGMTLTGQISLATHIRG